MVGLMIAMVSNSAKAQVTCPQNYFYNTTSLLCKPCSYGQFYVKVLNKCIDCAGSCTDTCAYQSICMQCNSTQVLDLTSYTCVNSCNTTTSVLLSDAQFGIASFCRGFDYYVDPTSSAVVELGTMQFPYKSLALVFVEMLNYHANTARTINIYLKENTESYVDLGFNYIINMKTVNIKPYSSTSSSPSKATIIAGEQNSPSSANITAYFNNGTTFNLLKNTQLRKSQQILSSFSSTEINYLTQTSQVFTVHRTNFTVYNIVMNSVFDNINSGYTFLFAVYLQNRNFNLTNIDFRVSGIIFQTFDPLNFKMENIDIDYSRNIYGFNIYPTCNYPAAYIGGIVNLTNINLYYSNGDRLVSAVFGHAIRYSGPANFYVNSVYSKIYRKYSEQGNSIYYQMQSSCLPMIDTTHYISYKNVTMTLSFNNDLYDKIASTICQVYIDYYRHHSIIMSDISSVNVSDNLYPSFWVVGNSMIDTFVNGFKSFNATSQMCLFICRSVNSITLKNFLFENSTASNQYMLMAYQSDNITISNITMTNVVGVNTDAYSFIYVTNLKNGFISINGLYMYNSSLDQHDGIFIDNYSSSTPSYLTLTNCIYSNIVMKSSTALIRTSVMKNLNLSNISFSNVTQIDPSDSSNNMIDIGGMDFNTTGSFSIDQLYATNSSISMLNMRNIINTNITNNQTLTMSNSGYSNSTIRYSDNIINLKNIEIDSTLQLQIFNISMTGITFIRGGNLILFQQQTKSPLIVTNSLFQNIYGGGIQFEAYNKNNLTLITSISFINMTVTNFSGNTQSFLTATTGSAISVYNSSFANNCNYMNGAVASANAQSASISFYNSTFQNNTAVKGAVFNVDNQGYISCSNCTLQNNFAIQSGVIQASNDGYFGIYSSVVSNNYAFTIPIGELFLASVTSIFSNCTISNNIVFASDYIIAQLTKCDMLCFMLSDFKTFISQNTQLMNSSPTEHGFQLISGNLQFDNATLIQNQNYFVSSFQSSLSLINVTIQNCVSYLNTISISYSSLNAINLTLSNITKFISNKHFISALFESNILIDKLKYTNSSAALIDLYSASLTLSNIEASSLNINDYLISMSNCYNVSIQNTTISSLNSTSDAVIYSLSSFINLVQNVSLSNINAAGLILDQSKATAMLMLSLLSMDKGIIIRSNSAIYNLFNSTFAQLGSSNIFYGGAIDVTDSSLNITNCNFEQNKAMSGAAISIRCLSNKNCDNQYSSTQFNNNKAEQQGGAIYYNFIRPMLTNCIFYGNNAPYGPILASYPVKIVEQSSLNTSVIYNNVPSGIKVDSPLVLELRDYDGQTIPDSIYQVKINPVSSNASTAGYNSAKAANGVATFNNLIFVSSPGAQHINFKATSNAIDIKMNTALNMSTFSTIDVSFRFCMPGEAQISSSICQTCAPGTYSFIWNSTDCQNCLSNTVCAGGTDIEVNPEYWRISTNSTTILDCPFPSACLGGFYPDSKYPVKCTTGYKGYLCSECDIVDGEKYVKTSGNQCSKCSIPLVNALKFCGLIILSFAFLTILIVILIRKKRENQTSILMRIMTNYVQLIAVSMTFKVKFPVSLTQLFGPINLFGSTSDTYLSYDCFISGIQVTAFTPSVQLFKIVLTGFMPIGLFVLYLAIWGCLYFAMNKWFSSIKRNMIISAICIIFMFHPTIMKSCLQIFECTLVNENDKRMDLYMDYKCYSKEHFFWIGTVAIPILVVWVIGAPVLALLILFRHRKHLEQGYIKDYMLILYQGLKPNAFYWEFVNTLRKGLILCCSVFLSTESPIYQTLCSVIILIIIMRLQQFIKPYKNAINNDMEQNAVNAGIVTLFCGIVFSQTQTNYDIFNTIALSFLIIVNTIFIIEWVFFLLLSLNFKHEKFRALLKIYAFIILKKKFLEKYKTQESTSTVMQPSSSKPEHKSIIKKVNIKNKSKKYKVVVNKKLKYNINKKHKLFKQTKLDVFDTNENKRNSIDTEDQDLSVFTKINKTGYKAKKARIDSKTVIFQVNCDSSNLKIDGKILDVCDELEEIEEETKNISPLEYIYSQSD